jgi:hypothetical protein
MFNNAEFVRLNHLKFVALMAVNIKIAALKDVTP